MFSDKPIVIIIAIDCYAKKSKRISWWLAGLNVFLSAQFWVALSQSFSHTNIFDTLFQHTIRDTTINRTIYFYFSCFCCSSPFVSLYKTLFRYSNGMLGAIKLTSDKMYGVWVLACTRFLFFLLCQLVWKQWTASQLTNQTKTSRAKLQWWLNGRWLIMYAAYFQIIRVT